MTPVQTPAQLTFIEKIKAWFKKLLREEEKVLSDIETFEKTVHSVEAVLAVVDPVDAVKLKAISETIDATIAAVRGTNVTIKKVAEEVQVVEIAVEASFKKGRFDETEIATITNAIALAGKLEVDWNTLSTNLNRDVKSIKAKAKLITK